MMINSEHLLHWLHGSIEFTDLLERYPQHNHASLAKELRIPFPEYLVSVRHAMYWWPETDEDRIVKARRDYDLGTHEMATGRTKFQFYLYSFPRDQPAPKRFYFTWAHG